MNITSEYCVAARVIASPVGELVILASASGITGLYFGHRIERRALPPDDQGNASLDAAAEQLGEYFSGARRRFELPLDSRGTEFQQSVWAQLRQIPYGETASYGDLARRLGKPGAMRAVGSANGANPISIIVPCHRVIGADGSLGGFGGGLEIKRRLLEHEGALLPVG